MVGTMPYSLYQIVKKIQNFEVIICLLYVTMGFVLNYLLWASVDSVLNAINEKLKILR